MTDRGNSDYAFFAVVVDDIFESFSYCASLHPDPSMMEEGDDEAFNRGDFEAFTEEDRGELSEVGKVRSNFNDNQYQPY